MAIKDTGIAAKAKETPAKSAEEMLRQARQEQKFMGISKDDNASTTGRLVNPPAAVIPNPNGAGGEAGATGFFGTNLLGARVGSGTNQTSTRYNPLSNNQNNFTPAGNGGYSIGIVRQDISGLSALEQSRIMYGNTTASGFGKLSYGFNNNQQDYTPNLNTSRINPYPPVVKAGGTKPAIPPSYTNTIDGDKQSEVGRTIPINSIGGDKQSQLASPATTSTAPTAPSTEITRENYSQWVDYWNWQARNPSAARAQITADAIAKGKPDPFAPVVMTREQIWQMKAEQRRKGMWKSAGDDISTGGYSRPTYSPTPYMGTGNYYSTIINTGSG